MLRVDVVTIFPELIRHYAAASILGRAAERGLLDVRSHDPRDATGDVHRTVDDAPFGGGAGMVMKAGPIIETVRSNDLPSPRFLLAPAGRVFDQSVAEELAGLDAFTLVCGRYEGVDERVRDTVVDDALSIGDVVLAGGELAALVVIEAVARLVPGVLGNDESWRDESFASGLLEYPQYTRPAELDGLAVPEVLRSGDHARVDRWRRAQALDRTRRWRPDLLARRGGLDDADRAVLREFGLDDEWPTDGDGSGGSDPAGP